MNTREQLSNALSISCVENYFLAWCVQNDIDVTMLYSSSFVAINKLYEDFMVDNAKYESYSEIPRVMETAEKHGFIKHQVHTDFDECVINEHIQKGDLVLVEVNDKFFKGFSRVPWRTDHFIWLSEKADGEYRFFNNYPLCEGKLTQGELQEVFSKKVLVYSKTEDQCARGIESDSLIQLNRIIQNGAKEIVLSENVDLFKTRSMLGILKVSRRRVAEWFAYMNNGRHLILDDELKNFMEEYISFLDKLFVKLEAGILRKRIDIVKLQEDFNVIMLSEKKLSGLIKMRRIIDEQIKYY